MSDAKSISEHRALFPENYLRSSSEEYYEWKINKNPFVKGLIYLEHHQGIVAGSFTITTKKISIEGEEIFAAELGDAFTHPDHRKKGIFIRGLNACIEYAKSHGIELIYAAAPNSQSLPIFINKTSFSICSHVKLNYLEKPLWRILPLIKSVIKKIIPGKSDTYLGHLIKQSLYKIKPSELFKGFNREDFDIIKISEMTDEVDGLWNSKRSTYCTVRDKEYLNWRYFENPDQYSVLAAKQDNKYLGYIVTKLSNDKKIGAICDFITAEDRLDVFYFLLKMAEKELNREGVQWIRLWCVEDSPYYAVLQNIGYLPHSAYYREVWAVLFNSERCKKILEQDARWHLTWADSDNV